MPMMFGSKRLQLRKLAELRRQTDLNTYFGAGGEGLYQHVGAFCEGAFDCEYVSPWTISGANVDARYLVIGQDWSSSDQLEAFPPNRHVIDHGFDPKFITNGLLDLLLEKHLNTMRRECYLTNLFPFIKSGGAGSNIPMGHFVQCAKDFLVPQIQIVAAPIVLCLGLNTFIALARALDGEGATAPAVAIGDMRECAQSVIFAMAHTGAQGTMNRGMDQVHRDWQRVAAFADRKKCTCCLTPL